MIKNWLKLIISILICQTAGFIGSLFTSSSVRTWYPYINKPGFTPPDSVFAPVWTLLYVMMGVSLFLVWKVYREKDIRSAVKIFFIQLFLNTAWSFFFFGLKSPLFGFVVIIILWLAILFTIIKFFKISRVAGYLLIPYIAWVSFASVLNLSIFLLN